jgi:hypothetical protein
MLLAINLQEFAPFLSVSSNSRLLDCAALASKLQVLPQKLTGKIEVDAAGRLSFRVDNGPQIVFGSRERLDAKLRRLMEAIKAEPALPSLRAVVSIVEPSGPAMIKLEE